MNGMNAFYTHQQYLIRELRMLNYSRPVKCLEFGAGDGSASVFRGFLMDNPNLYVDAFDTSLDWSDQMTRDYSHPNYRFFYIADGFGFLNTEYFKEVYDIVFVDQSPFDARIQTIDALAEKTKVFILHDYDYFNKGVTENIFSVGSDSFFAKYAKDFTLEPHCMILPPTLIMRNNKILE